MPSLRSLLSTIAPPTIGNPHNVFFVKNTSNSVMNGGCCYLWTVPSGVTTATFELWGAGASGPGARNCEFGGIMPTAGSYVVSQRDVTAGQAFTICAGGTGCDGTYDGLCCDISPDGFPSFVIYSGSTVICAPGGMGGDLRSSCGNVWAYSCCWARLNTNSTLGDFSIRGMGSGTVRNQYCHSNMYDVDSNGWASGGTSSDFCAVGYCWRKHGFEKFCTCPGFPSAPGHTASACGDGYNYGQHGGAGLVKVTYS